MSFSSWLRMSNLDLRRGSTLIAIQKGKVIPLHAMEMLGVGGGGGDSDSFLTSAVDGVSGQLYPRGKDPRYALYKGLGGPQGRSGR
jgi:hypothetical protein